jgi:PAS domain S-box-containing protein
MSDRSKASILIVEDERIVAMDLQQTLIELGYETCEIASSASEAVQQCALRHPDLALMDIRIKGPQDGVQTAALLRDKFQISVIYLTAHADSGMIERAKQTNPLGYLVKPVKAAELHRTIEIALHRITREAAERERTEQLVALASNSLDSKSYIDREYHYRYVNDAHLQLWSVARHDVEGQHVSKLLGDEVFFKTVKPHLDRAFSGELVTCQACIEFPRWGRRYMDITYIPVRNADNAIAGVVVRTHDIDDLKRTAEQLKTATEVLERKNLSLQRLVSTLSHDLREPVNTLANYSALLSEEFAAALPAPAQRYVTHLQCGSQRLRLLLDDLVSFTRLGQELRASRPCDLNRIFDDVVADLADVIGKSNAVITRADLPAVSGQPTLLRLMIQNLISNALKFVEAHTNPSITADAKIEDAWCELCLSDNGIGIEEAHREKIFELFARLHSRNEYEGTGFGLAACRHIAELHGGRIWVTSSESNGSCFHVTLPLCSGQLH